LITGDRSEGAASPATCVLRGASCKAIPGGGAVPEPASKISTHDFWNFVQQTKKGQLHRGATAHLFIRHRITNRRSDIA
jgi:hypothetical protein